MDMGMEPTAAAIEAAVGFTIEATLHYTTLHYSNSIAMAISFVSS